MLRPLLALVIVACCAVAAHADNWPAWRGPTGQGFCDGKNVPLKWSDKDRTSSGRCPLEDPG